MPTRTTLPIITRKDSSTVREKAACQTTPISWLKESKNPSDLIVLGMCSGAALGGVSCVLLRYRQQSRDGYLRVFVLRHEEIAVPLQLRSQTVNLLHHHSKDRNAMIRVHSLIGYMHATSVKRFCKNRNIPQESTHSLALWFVTPPMPPPQMSEMEPIFRSWTAVIASETGMTTVTSLPVIRRPVSWKNPTVGPSVEDLFLQHPTKFHVCVMINELLYITMVSPAEDEPRFPPPNSVCGPGTMLVDYAMRYATCDRVKNDYNGKFALQGTASDSVVRQFLKSNDYSTRIPPLNIATELFGHHEAQGIVDECLFLGLTDHDIVATITRITAENIVRQYKRFVAAHCTKDHKIDELFICSPGALNVAIVDYLEEELPNELTKRPLDNIGIPGEAKEAMCCALLGLETIREFSAAEDGPFQRNQHTRLTGSVEKGNQ
ncbi:hypothetical protein PMIN04_012516 [Paraphaeosphaeria minitans]